MVIDELIKVLPPPDSPSEGGTGLDWGAVTARLGEPLPTDYMQFIEKYGSGTINGLIRVLNPFSSADHINFWTQMQALLAAFRALRAEDEDDCPYPLMYEPGGLLPWGVSLDGDVYFWETTGLSGKWTVVVSCRDSGDFEEFAMPMTRFLARAIKGEIESGSLYADFGEAEGRSFEKHTP